LGEHVKRHGEGSGLVTRKRALQKKGVLDKAKENRSGGVWVVWGGTEASAMTVAIHPPGKITKKRTPLRGAQDWGNIGGE